MVKKITAVLIISILTLILMAGCGYTSDEPCAWCNSTPTKKIASDMIDDAEAYYYGSVKNVGVWVIKMRT